MKKLQLRSKIKSKRDSLSFYENRTKSIKINYLLRHSKLITNSKTICIYVSKNSEVQTLSLINSLLKDKIVLIPFVIKEKLEVGKINSVSELRRGAFNILEPKEKKTYSGKIDLIVVPGIAFDMEGNRIGYGKGFYDRFLRSQQGIKVGLCFETQITSSLPCDKNDIKMDFMVTEDRIITCKKKLVN